MSSQEIRTHISSIINCYICNIGRASNMFWLTFSTSSQEIDANKHEIAIHVQYRKREKDYNCFIGFLFSLHIIEKSKQFQMGRSGEQLI